MTNDTLNENALDEKTIHERMAIIEVKLISLKSAIQNLCNRMIISEEYKSYALQMEETLRKLDRMKLQLNYWDDAIQDAKLQRQNKPLIIRLEKKL